MTLDQAIEAEAQKKINEQILLEKEKIRKIEEDKEKQKQANQPAAIFLKHRAGLSQFKILAFNLPSKPTRIKNTCFDQGIHKQHPKSTKCYRNQHTSLQLWLNYKSNK